MWGATVDAIRAGCSTRPGLLPSRVTSLLPQALIVIAIVAVLEVGWMLLAGSWPPLLVSAACAGLGFLLVLIMRSWGEAEGVERETEQQFLDNWLRRQREEGADSETPGEGPSSGPER